MTDAATEEDQTRAAARREEGEFVRGVSRHRDALGDPGLPPEPGRYHLYVALNCPWCHRVALARSLLGLAKSVTMDVVFPNRTTENDPAGPNHWQFAPDKAASLTGAPLPECTRETASGEGFRLVPEIYAAEGSDEKSLPILYDRRQRRIVNNESAEILRMLGRHAAALGGRDDLTLYPDELADEIDGLNVDVYEAINNGAYKAGFSSSQDVYATAYARYFDMLGALETRLADGRAFLTGARFTEADLRLFPTLYRHDPVYYLRMKLNGAKILDYPNLWRWLCRVHALPGVAESGSLIHCRQGYFGRSWNNVVPLGPDRPMAYPDAYGRPDLARD